ncbi:tight adherence protein B [Paenarthrobacter nicotinovorans]|uniref:type II secretion system F family protein n=1 Tax=Paenarthrobacter nicotinovorans TaxID=29320 RepID=UPI00278301CB|nr:hypothetical protein [Paenarthrobacter nicotinovorans]MDP9936165.1 tight adherence protein B [Paenarthrobacter nicotinovorans]
MAGVVQAPFPGAAAMMSIMVLVLAYAAWLQFRGDEASRRRRTRSLGKPGDPGSRPSRAAAAQRLLRRRSPEPLKLVVLVQQLAALLRGGRGTSALWEELWLVHDPRSAGEPAAQTGAGRGTGSLPLRSTLSAESLKVLGAARAASTLGNSPAEAIRRTAAQTYPPRGSSERRVWMELAACMDVAEASGCPLADLLTRFSAQLEAEEDAEAARQTALAGPKATVRLLSWLPLFGLVLGMILGVDPLGILLGNPWGVATFAAGLLLTVAGRIWSSTLVAAAAGGN